MSSVQHSKTLHRTTTAALLLAALLLGACSKPEPAGTQTNAPVAGNPIPAFTAQQLAAQPTDNWITSGGSLSNERYSPLADINKSNIAQVKAEWQVHLDSGLGAQHSGQGEPLVYDGIIYHVTGQNDVFAISVDTGKILWKYTAGLDPKGVVVCCGWAVRGIAVGDGKVFVPRLDAHLLALDAKTGNVIWDTTVADPKAGYSLTGAPRYYDGKVFAGVAGGEYQVRGSMQAFDAATGKNLWTFYTVPGPGEFGHDSWPADNDSWKYGGAPIWQTAAIDPELGLMYFSTGNASPDLNGGIRKGDNLFTISILALDLNTGAYKWHFQETRHDIWDYDASSPVVLFDVEKDGVMRKGLSQISKSGYLFILDRVTGQGLTEIKDVPVPQEPEQQTAATQPIPQGDSMINHCIDKAPEGYTLVNNGCTYTPYGRKGGLYAPLSGSNWMPTAYDPRSGNLYLCASESIGGAVMQDWTPKDLGVQTGNMIYGGAFQLPRGTTRHSYQIAVDVRTHKIVWKQEQQNGCTTGATVTAGDLLLISRNNGKLMAYDSANGNELWSFQLDAPAVPSPVVFTHNGKQKILVFAGGSLFAGGGKSDSLWLLSLDGKQDQSATVTAAAPPPSINNAGQQNTATANVAPQPDMPLPAGEVNLARGKEIYGLVCNACHGVDGQGGHAEGGAMPKNATVEHIFSTATRGGQKMPSFGAAFKPDELKSVAVYVRQEVLK
ncbi:MAG TPA: PQQ-binding-like beta-propeller repeat protein [Candidatus Acidoferrum sp.]|nr:PQQ-binding-like beta-propeller repeat protein [Candidatus Acidoferrum sp.]